MAEKDRGGVALAWLFDPPKYPEVRWAAGAMDNAEDEDFATADSVNDAPGVAEGAAVHLFRCGQFFAFPKGKRITGDPVDGFIKGVPDFYRV